MPAPPSGSWSAPTPVGWSTPGPWVTPPPGAAAGAGGVRLSTAPTQATPPVYATFLPRFFGYFIDSVLVGLLVALVSFMAGLAAGIGVSLAEWPGALVGAGIFTCIGVFLYCKLIPFQMADHGATPGMRLVNIEVVGSADLMYIGRFRAFMRCVVAVVLSVIAGFVTYPLQLRFLDWTVEAGLTQVQVDPRFGMVVSASFSYLLLSYVVGWVGSGIPFLACFTNRRRKTLQDMVCRTVVVRQMR